MRRRMCFAGDLNATGLGEATRRVMSALRSADVEVVAGDDHRAGDRSPLVLHGMPASWPAADRHRHEPVIGMTVWEAETLPSHVLAHYARTDLLWVPTRWNQRVFRDAGFDATVVVPHPIAAGVVDYDPHSPLPVDVGPDTTVFVEVSTWDWRKRPDRTIDAYLHAFSSADDVLLVVKSAPTPVAWPQPWRPVWTYVVDAIKARPRLPRIALETERWNEQQLLSLLRRADCYVSLTSGEGWGLGAFDAACLGTPVLITGWGGQREWLGDDYPGLLPFELEQVVDPGGTSFEPGQWWARPDQEAAIEAMRSVHANRAPMASAAARLRPTLLETYAPAVIADHILEVTP